MIVKDYMGGTFSIKKNDPHRHKYADAMAEYLDYLDYGMVADGYSGDSECLTGHFARFGRRILVGDDRGFVWVEKWPSEQSARQVYDAMDHYYGWWADEESDLSESVRAAMLDLCNLFLDYVTQCAVENLEAFDFDRWTMEDQPKGPLG